MKHIRKTVRIYNQKSNRLHKKTQKLCISLFKFFLNISVGNRLWLVPLDLKRSLSSTISKRAKVGVVNSSVSGKEAGTYWKDRSDGDSMGVVCRRGSETFWKYGLPTPILELVNGWLLHGIKYKCIELHISLYALFEQFKLYSPILICAMPSAYLL